jgi:hypothetical protein
MGRSKDSENQSNYHFVVWFRKDPTSMDETPTKKYYRTTAEIQKDFGICRSTVYNFYTKVINDKNKRKTQAIVAIDKLATPVPIYKKIMVTFD